MNVDNLPTELSYTKPHSIVLKCTWNVEVDAGNLVKRILVTLLDVSAEVEARKKLDEKNEEFNIVRQLIDIGAANSRQFFASGLQLFAENDRLLASSEIDNEIVKILFINMHTLKGAARTLHLNEMSEQFHLIESYYADILRNGAGIDQAKLLADFKAALAIFNHYLLVNTQILGRTEDASKVVIDRDFLEQNFRIFHFLDKTYLLDSNLQVVIRDNCNQLVKLIFMSLPSIMDDILKHAGWIARDLQKLEPLVTIDMDDILITHKNEVAIKNAFVHLLRNSLDHGIESSDIRIGKGKDPRGHIKVTAQVQGEQLAIRFEDDGAGLAIGRLREKGLALALIKADAEIQAIAELIFHQGMSTAKSVSRISGRGIGMDAVRRFIEGESGTVKIYLDDCIDKQNQLYRFHFVILLPNRASHLCASKF
jgi:signal transduction histidine kinase